MLLLRPLALIVGLTTAVQAPARHFNPRWSPDGRRIMLDGNLENPRRLDLFTIAAEGGELVKVRNDGRNGSWSPDGKRILFASASDGDLDVYVMNADGSAVQQLTNTPEMDYLPAWSPDGRRIAFVSIPPGQGQHHEIHVMNQDGSGRAAITQTPDAEEMSPAWSPDGRRMAFATNRDGNWEIYGMNADGSDVRRLTNDPAGDSGPAYAPDGKTIVFTSDRGGSRRIWRMSAGGEAPTPIERSGSMLAWAPDGRRLAYVGQEEGVWGVFVMNADGSGARRVTAIPPAPVVATRLVRLRWLAGCWELTSAQRTTLEMWMPPEGELMLGASRTVSGGITREFEQLRLEAKGDTLVYTASPSGQRETAFRSTQVSDSGFIVENLAHDFPQRIIYRRRGADSLVARIEGPGQGGPRGMDFPMRRAACVAP